LANGFDISRSLATTHQKCMEYAEYCLHMFDRVIKNTGDNNKNAL
jgi:hypothetical protein